MASDAADGLDYWVRVPRRFTAALYALRPWPDLRVGFTDEDVWLRGLSATQISSAAVLALPRSGRYALREGRLYPVGKRLPERTAPTLLWSELTRGLKVTLPAENFNYFGTRETYGLELVTTSAQQPTDATVVDLAALGGYLYDAPCVRTAGLRWTVLAGGRAFVVGAPLLPIPGEDYYRRGGFFLPAGRAFRYEGMAGVYRAALADAADYHYLVAPDGALRRLRRADLAPLSKGSFAATFPDR